MPSCCLWRAPRCHRGLLCVPSQDLRLRLWESPVGGWTHQQEQWEDPEGNSTAAYCCATSGISLSHQIVTCWSGRSSLCSPGCKSRCNPSTNEPGMPHLRSHIHSTNDSWLPGPCAALGPWASSPRVFHIFQARIWLSCFVCPLGDVWH